MTTEIYKIGKNKKTRAAKMTLRASAQVCADIAKWITRREGTKQLLAGDSGRPLRAQLDLLNLAFSCTAAVVHVGLIVGWWRTATMSCHQHRLGMTEGEPQYLWTLREVWNEMSRTSLR